MSEKDQSEIISLEDWRIARKNYAHPYNVRVSCSHKSLVIDGYGEIITCSDCKAQVTAYWVVMALLDGIKRQRAKLQSALETVKAERSVHVHTVAAKRVEGAWRRKDMVPTCPHCSAGIYPDDGFGGNLINRQFEDARRASGKLL